MDFIYKVVCVGCGGTGSFFIKEFARFMAANEQNTERKTAIGLGIIDGDSVELSNLERQAFVAQDINSNKAVVMASAISDNFGLADVYAYPFYLEKESQLRDIFSSLNANSQSSGYGAKYINVLIGTVDNHRARQIMHEYFYSAGGTIFYFDSANGYSDGEVVFSGRHNSKVLGRPRGYFFPEVLTDTSPGANEMSCTQLNVREPQHIATNMMAANILLSNITILIREGNIKFGIAFFDTFNMWMVFRQDEMEDECVANAKKKN